MEQSLWERLWTNRRRQILTAACVLGLVVIAVYIWLIFSPGVRYRGVFLSPQEDGSYAGSSLEYAYRLAVAPGSGETSIDFTVNGETRTYRVVRTPRENGSGEEVSFYRDGEFAARTDAWPNAGAYSLDVYAIDGYVLETFSEGSFPTFSQLYEWSAAFQTDTRGYPVFLLLFFLVLAVLILDIAFPNLFFYLQHGLAVDGGEPSGFYRAGQKLGRVVIAILLVLIIFWTFYPPI